MPTGWKVGAQGITGRDVPMDAPCRKPGHVCEGRVSNAGARYGNTQNTGNLNIEMFSFEDVEAAQREYEERSASYAGEKDREVAMPTVGDVSIARSGANEFSGWPFTSLVMRVGTVVVAMAYTHRDAPDPQMLLALARMEAKRLQQAQSGEEPTASL
ncbi:hypothetical protein [Streptomyces chilikensis]|uniref:Uncharacterized protein n=1 Tax=Streptomyces chilikensis TaxID=1194079 RepID=A0ABV3EJY6_9ACTN